MKNSAYEGFLAVPIRDQTCRLFATGSLVPGTTEQILVAT